MRVSDLAYDYSKYGIMNRLKVLHSELPWESAQSGLPYKYDLMYNNHSGFKRLATFAAYLADHDRFDEVAEYVYGLYGPKWLRSYPLIGDTTAPYDPLIDTMLERVVDENGNTSAFKSINRNTSEDMSNDFISNESNHNRSEDIERDHLVSKGIESDHKGSKKIGSDNEKINNNSFDSRTSNEVRNEDVGEKIEEFVNHDVYGFNSSTPVDSYDTKTDTDRGTITQEETVNKELSNTGSRNNKIVDSVLIDDESNESITDSDEVNFKENQNDFNGIRNTTDSNDKHTNTNVDDREHNNTNIFKGTTDKENGIKNHTYQELAKQELELMLESYYCMVFDDIDKCICNSFYGAIY